MGNPAQLSLPGTFRLFWHFLNDKEFKFSSVPTLHQISLLAEFVFHILCPFRCGIWLSFTEEKRLETERTRVFPSEKIWQQTCIDKFFIVDRVRQMTVESTRGHCASCLRRRRREVESGRTPSVYPSWKSTTKCSGLCFQILPPCVSPQKRKKTSSIWA